jgi:hypothetical protein
MKIKKMINGKAKLAFASFSVPYDYFRPLKLEGDLISGFPI